MELIKNIVRQLKEVVLSKLLSTGKGTDKSIAPFKEEAPFVGEAD